MNLSTELQIGITLKLGDSIDSDFTTGSYPTVKNLSVRIDTCVILNQFYLVDLERLICILHMQLQIRMAWRLSNSNESSFPVFNRAEESESKS